MRDKKEEGLKTLKDVLIVGCGHMGSGRTSFGGITSMKCGKDKEYTKKTFLCEACKTKKESIRLTRQEAIKWIISRIHKELYACGEPITKQNIEWIIHSSDEVGFWMERFNLTKIDLKGDSP